MNNLYQICSLFGSVKSIIIWCVIGAIAIGLIVLAIYNKIAMYAELVILCFALVFSGIFAGYYDVMYFVNKNSIHGQSTEGVHNQTLGSFNAVTKTFTFTRFGFASTSEENKYECSLEFVGKSLDLSNESNLYVNNEACDNVTKDSDYIKAEYRQIFLDDENVVLYDDTLFVSIHSNKNKLAISLITKGGDKAVGYWRTFLIENNFQVTFGANNRPNNTTIDVDSSQTPKELFNQKCDELISSIGISSDKSDISKVEELQTLIKTYISVNGYDCSTASSSSIQKWTSGNYFGLTIFDRSSEDIHNAYFKFSQLIATTNIRSYDEQTDRYYVSYNSSNIALSTNVNNGACSIFYDEENTTGDYYSMLLLNLRDFTQYNWMFDQSNFAGSIPETWYMRKDFDHQELIQNYEFPVTSYLVLKDTSEDYVQSLLSYIYQKAFAELDGKENDTYKLTIDLSDYFYNLIFDSSTDSYSISNGAINIEFSVNLSVKD